MCVCCYCSSFWLLCSPPYHSLLTLAFLGIHACYYAFWHNRRREERIVFRKPPSPFVSRLRRNSRKTRRTSVWCALLVIFLEWIETTTKTNQLLPESVWKKICDHAYNVCVFDVYGQKMMMHPQISCIIAFYILYTLQFCGAGTWDT